MNLEYEDALGLLVRWLQEPDYGGTSAYGYDIYLPNLLRVYLRKEKGIHSQSDIEQKVGEIMTSFYPVAWDLCRRGILRPGIYRYGAQATDDGNAGNGYSITPFGRQWLSEKDHDAFVPTEPERFAKMLLPYKEKLGAPFHERAQEAIRCYGAHAYLVLCLQNDFTTTDLFHDGIG